MECEKLIVSEMKFENAVKVLVSRYNERTGTQITDILKKLEIEMLCTDPEKDEIVEFLNVLKQKTAETSAETSESAQKTAEMSAETSESASKTAESLTDRQRQVLNVMNEKQDI